MSHRDFAQVGTSAIKWELHKSGDSFPSDSTIKRVLKSEGLVKKTSYVPIDISRVLIVPLDVQKAVTDEKDPHLIASATGVAARIGSDFVKVNYPKKGRF